jgi:hypothetical protein
MYTPNHSSIRKVEIEIQGMDIRNMKLLPDKTGDVIEDVAKIKVTRHYRFSEGNSENKRDSKRDRAVTEQDIIRRPFHQELDGFTV